MNTEINELHVECFTKQNWHFISISKVFLQKVWTVNLYYFVIS